jgi:hypothetical protein
MGRLAVLAPSLRDDAGRVLEQIRAIHRCAPERHVDTGAQIALASLR